MPRRYCEREQVLILRLLEYFQLEKDAGKPLLHVNTVYNRVSDALGVSISTMQKLNLTGVQKDDTYNAKTSLAISSSGESPLYKIHQHVIRTRIYAMYAAGEHVTLHSLRLSLLNIY
ncbi:hypothetical protein ABEB36_013970 [Hypothenemus hampei]|uniref:Uncharacterized protein n=1 Tax=Hypothenemus hampei TaxID=57062 RepID=A0ABD1E3V4_HYPHA